ncbi:hypothetical protein B0H16DRAFT_1467283 [Mycena metata]|uniref:Uncharacterized protein n=1 Tax=Mycena metata TaxID=1033252 RepID=A0AAD7I4K1_9AGAR|nr:hypothetical protein B0H16DRAFT_1467283 [Mycena metata]
MGKGTVHQLGRQCGHKSCLTDELETMDVRTETMLSNMRSAQQTAGSSGISVVPVPLNTLLNLKIRSEQCAIPFKESENTVHQGNSTSGVASWSSATSMQLGGKANGFPNDSCRYPGGAATHKDLLMENCSTKKRTQCVENYSANFWSLRLATCYFPRFNGEDTRAGTCNLQKMYAARPTRSTTDSRPSIWQTATVDARYWNRDTRRPEFRHPCGELQYYDMGLGYTATQKVPVPSDAPRRAAVNGRHEVN